jgi:hypothetical protein
LVVAAVCLSAVPAEAITVVVDYTYDATANGGSNFFGSGNPQGSAAGLQAKAALDAAAAYYSTVLRDTFSAITVPPVYHSSTPGSNGTVTWSWEAQLQHPSGTSQVSVPNLAVGIDQYIVYAGARNLPGSTAAEGGGGGFSRPAPVISGSGFTASDSNNINTITANFDAAITTRGETTGFAGWGGRISFDNNGTTWHFNHLTAPSGSALDFYSVSLHELSHALGFGVSDEWQALKSGSNFNGADARAQNGNTAVPLTADGGHWVSGKSSTPYGGSGSQEALMDPDYSFGVRKLLTSLDAAALKDIGWELVAGDYNLSTRVDAADYVLWRNMLGQTVSIQGAVADGSANGHIGNEDLTFWRNRFNNTFAPGGGTWSGNSFAAPEPAGVAMFAAGAIFVNARRKRRR